MSRRVSVSAYYWIDEWQRDQTEVFAIAAEAGFDGIELSLYAQPNPDPVTVRRAADASGLEILVSTGVPERADPSSPDPTIRDAAVEYLTGCLETAGALGSRVLGGLTYAPWMVFPDAADPAGARERAASTLRRVAPVAERLDVTLCIEPVNRFETYVCNTAEHGRAIVEAVASSAVAVQLDTFHMNIEESDPAAAIREAGAALGHFQVADNDRSVPGSGTIDFAALGAALDDIGYDGWVGLETFPHPNKQVGHDTFTWRPLVTSLRDDAAAGLETIRTHLGGANR